MTKTFDNHTGMKASTNDVNTILQSHLASSFDLFSQLKQAHWNLKGPHFIAIHEMLDGFAGSMRGHVDTLAERIVALGGYPLGDVRSAAQTSVLEAPQELVNDIEWVSFILGQYSVLSHKLYVDIEHMSKLDPASEDLLIGIVRDVDQTIYFLGSHVNH